MLKYKPEGKRSLGRLQKRWMDVAEKDLNDLGAQNWRNIVQVWDKLSDLVMAVKTFGE